MKKFDFTRGKKPNKFLQEEYCLKMTFQNGIIHCFYGKTKKEAKDKFKKAFGSTEGFIEEMWEII